jgi:hypothetical protein
MVGGALFLCVVASACVLSAAFFTAQEDMSETSENKAGLWVGGNWALGLYVFVCKSIEIEFHRNLLSTGGVSHLSFITPRPGKHRIACTKTLFLRLLRPPLSVGSLFALMRWPHICSEF